MQTQIDPNFYKTSKTVGNREYTLRVMSFGETLRGMLTYQVINAKTGKPWQAVRDVFDGRSDEAPAQALSLYLKLGVS